LCKGENTSRKIACSSSDDDNCPSSVTIGVDVDVGVDVDALVVVVLKALLLLNLFPGDQPGAFVHPPLSRNKFDGALVCFGTEMVVKSLEAAVVRNIFRVKDRGESFMGRKEKYIAALSTIIYQL